MDELLSVPDAVPAMEAILPAPEQLAASLPAAEAASGGLPAMPGQEALLSAPIEAPPGLGPMPMGGSAAMPPPMIPASEPLVAPVGGPAPALPAGEPLLAPTAGALPLPAETLAMPTLATAPMAMGGPGMLLGRSESALGPEPTLGPVASGGAGPGGALSDIQAGIDKLLGLARGGQNHALGGEVTPGLGQSPYRPLADVAETRVRKRTVQALR